jgi:putative transposase
VRRLAAALDCGGLPPRPLHVKLDAFPQNPRDPRSMEKWQHAPLHWFAEAGRYIITAGTYLKQPFFKLTRDLDDLQSLLFELANKSETILHAWSFFSNHYHLVVDSPSNPERLRDLVREFHSISAREINRRQEASGRRVWYQYWDTHLRSERAYFARLNYVNQNPVHHGIAMNACSYRWCSAAWFEANAKRSLLETLRQFDAERVKVVDDF